ncbi:MAG: NAD-dependent epimerase/dehydratase family protein [Nannocystaceae bacterium]|nr:NAD-dependent epimerase/dehydratase family protein [Nannocystaceae bacterium]
MYVVTGGAGFIGSSLVRALLADGEQVVVLDDFSTGHRANLEGLDGTRLCVIEANILDGLDAPMSHVEASWGAPTAIVHLAAQVSVAASLEDPIGDAHRNHCGTLHVLEFARKHSGTRVVFASSAATYGDVDEVPVREGSARWPLSPYGVHKFSSELSLRAYAEVHDAPTTSLRFFNVYGPRQDPNSPYSGVISIFMKRALAGEPLTVHGEGEQTRDFVFVSDVVQAIRNAASKDFSGDVFNVGTGEQTSIKTLAETIARLAGQDSLLTFAAPRLGDIVHSCAELSHSRAGLGYEPSVGLEDGLAQTLAWFQSESGN